MIWGQSCSSPPPLHTLWSPCNLTPCSIWPISRFIISKIQLKIMVEYWASERTACKSIKFDRHCDWTSIWRSSNPAARTPHCTGPPRSKTTWARFCSLRSTQKILNYTARSKMSLQAPKCRPKCENNYRSKQAKPSKTGSGSCARSTCTPWYRRRSPWGRPGSNKKSGIRNFWAERSWRTMAAWLVCLRSWVMRRRRRRKRRWRQRGFRGCKVVSRVDPDPLLQLTQYKTKFFKWK